MPSRLMRYVLGLLIIIVSVNVVDCKKASGTALLTGENSVARIMKFAVSAHERGSMDLTLSIPTDMGMYTDERPLKVGVFNEEKNAWKKAKKEPLCMTR